VNWAALPKISCDLDGRNLKARPPGHFVTAPMQFVMMLAAQRNGEFIAYFPPERLGLRKFEVVGVARCALADHAGLGRNENEMGLVSATRWPGARRCVVITGQGRRARLRCGDLTFRLGLDVSIVRDLRCRDGRFSGVDAGEDCLTGCFDRARVIGRKRIFRCETPMRPQGQLLTPVQNVNFGQQLVAQLPGQGFGQHRGRTKSAFGRFPEGRLVERLFRLGGLHQGVGRIKIILSGNPY
jgi:hypothetical protein